MSAEMSTVKSGWKRDRWVGLLQALGVMVAYWIVYFSVSLPVGVGYYLYSRFIQGEEPREVSMHLEDEMLFLQAAAWLLILLAMFVIIWLMLKWLDRGSSFADVGFRIGKRTWLAVLLAIVIATLLVVLIFLVGLAGGVIDLLVTPAEEQLWSDILTDFIGYLLLVGAFAATEELVFRGHIRFTLAKTFSPWATLAIAGLFYALSRWVLYSSGWLGATNAFLAGLILGMLFILSGSLWVPIAAHFMWVFMESFIFSFANAGIVPEGIFRLQVTSGTLLDGKYGPQGGLLVTFIFVVVAICLGYYTNKHIKAKGAAGQPPAVEQTPPE